MSIITKTIKTSGGDFSTIVEAIDSIPDYDAIASGYAYEFIIYAGDYIIDSYDYVYDIRSNSEFSVVFRTNPGDHVTINTNSYIWMGTRYLDIPFYVEFHGIEFLTIIQLHKDGGTTYDCILICNQCMFSALTASDNDIYGGIASWEGFIVRIYNSIFRADIGFSSGIYGDYFEVINCTFYYKDTDCYPAIIEFIGSNNVFYNNICITRYSTPDNAYIFLPGCISDYNIYVHNTNAYWLYDSTQYTTLTNFQTASGQDLHSLWVEPELVDSDNFDFTIFGSGSNVINMGKDVSSYSFTNKDFVNVTRPSGSAYDIGAYEFYEALKVSNPTFDPIPGIYYVNQKNVTITCSTDGATIYYTLDGTDPTSSSSLYTTPVIITTNKVLKAIAIKNDMTDSDITSGIYYIPSIIDNNTILLCHFNDTDPTYIDSSFYNHTITKSGVAIQTDTQKKFELKSLNPSPNGSQGSISITFDIEGNLDDFTFDTWVLFTTGNLYCDFFTFTTSSGYYTNFNFNYNMNDGTHPTSHYQCLCFAGKDYFNNIACDYYYNWIPVVNTWYHIALTRSLSTVVFFINGVKCIPITFIAIGSTTLLASGRPYRLGVYTGGWPTRGYFDESRLSNIVRYTNSFIPEEVEYQLPIAPPTFSPTSGIFRNQQNITINCSVPDVTIYYTIDGSTPSEFSNIYVTPIVITSLTTIKAIAIKTGLHDSLVVTSIYDIADIGGLDNNTKLLLHFNDTDPTYVDSSFSQHIIIKSGIAVQSATQKRFRLKALHPSDLSNYQSGYVYTAASADWNFNDFTFDLWVYFPTSGGNSYCWGSFITFSSPTDPFRSSGFGYNEGTGHSNCLFFSDFGYGYTLDYYYYWMPEKNTWYHIALVRSGSNVFFFINGTKYIPTVHLPIGSGMISWGSSPLYVTASIENSNRWFAGYVDEVRVSNVARWTNDFIPAGEEYHIPYVVTPTFDPIAGTYHVYKSITINCSTSGALIYYTTNGIDPTNLSDLYVSPIPITSTTTLKAIAEKSGLNNSDIASGEYIMDIYYVPTPTFFPTGNNNNNTILVQLNDTNADLIYYTIDGSPPTTSSNSVVPGQSILIDHNLTLKAKAVKTDWMDSDIASDTYTFRVASLSFDPGGGIYTSPRNVTISSITENCEIRYTTNGVDPDQSSSLYVSAIPVSSNITIKAKGFKSGYTATDIYSGSYTITGQLIQPVFNPDGGTYNNNQLVQITSDPGSTIYYTLDGNPPTTSSSHIDSGESIYIDYSLELKAKAIKTNWDDSTVNSKYYTLQVANCSFDPIAGVYTSPQPVTIINATSNADIRYTIDGNSPTQTSSQYINPILISSDTTLKARGFKSGYSQSISVTAGEYTITGTVATPILSNQPGEYPVFVDLTASCATPDAIIRYTTDGNDPTNISTIFPPTLHLNITTNLKVGAFKALWLDSAIIGGLYTINGIVADPSFSFDSGTYYDALSVVLTSDNGTTIHYTTNGDDPNLNSASINTGESVNVTISMTLKAFAVKQNWGNSQIVLRTYTLKVSPSDFHPEGGYYNETKLVTIDCPTHGVSIYYTIDGSQPDENTSPEYNNSITVDINLILQARVYKINWTPSNVVSQNYYLQVVTPIIFPDAGSYVIDQIITMTCSTVGATIYYSLDDTPPTIEYTTPVLINQSRLVRVIAKKLNWTDSLEVVDQYYITKIIEIPTFNISDGTYFEELQITISCATLGVTIHYTLDGSVPGSSSPVYNVPVVINRTGTLKAVAMVQDYSSSMAIAVYTLQCKAPIFNPSGGLYSNEQIVEINTKTVNTTIYYTEDGSDPTTSSTIYTGAITVNNDTRIKAMAVRSNWNNSLIIGELYTIQEFGELGLSQQSQLLSEQYRNYIEILFQQNKKLLDSEVNLLQNIVNDLIFKCNSGWLAKSRFSIDSGFNFYMGENNGDINRVIMNNHIIDICGTHSSNNYTNLIEMTLPPVSGVRTDIVFLEVWESIIRSGKTLVDGYSKPTADTIYNFGNVLYGGDNLLDDCSDLNLGETSGRTQIQYEIRVLEDKTSLTGCLCKDEVNTFSQTGRVWEALGTNHLFGKPEYNSNNSPLGYGYHWALPICLVNRVAGEMIIDLNGVVDLRVDMGADLIDPNGDYMINSFALGSSVVVNPMQNKAILYIDNADGLLKLKMPNGSIRVVATL